MAIQPPIISKFDDKGVKDAQSGFDKLGGVLGGIGKAALPMVGQAFGIPAPITQAAQGAIGQFNPQSNTEDPEAQQMQSNGSQMANMGMQAMNIYNAAQGFRKGGKMCYPNGGKVANAELEKSENFITPNGEFGQINGASHELGGVDVNIPGGTIIFSDKLKPKGSKKTYAILNKANNTKKEEEIVDDNMATKESKKTAELMKRVKGANSQKLFQDQEEGKYNRLAKYIKRLGGIQQFPGGGTFNPNDHNYQAFLAKNKGFEQIPGSNRFARNFSIPYGPTIPTAYRTFDPNQSYLPQNSGAQVNPNYQPVQFGPNTITNPNTGTISNYQNQPIQPQNFNFRNGGFKDRDNNSYMEDGIPYQGEGNWMKGVQGALNNNPYISNDPNDVKYPYVQTPTNLSNQLDPISRSNRTTGSTLDQPFNTPEYSRQPINWQDAAYQGVGTLAQSAGQLAYLKDQGKRYDTQKFYGYTPERLDPSSALRDADTQARTASYDLSNASGGNSGNYLANRIALSGNNTLNKASIRNKYANDNAQIGNSGQQFNIQNQYRTDDINAANKGQALSNYYNTIGSVGTNVASGMRDYRMDRYNKQMVDMLPDLVNDPAFRTWYKARYKS